MRRCGVAFANICKEIMPTEERGAIGQVRPSGWHTVKYNGVVDGNYLYNRCHLIGYQLAGENANELNLITGTRYIEPRNWNYYAMYIIRVIHGMMQEIGYSEEQIVGKLPAEALNAKFIKNSKGSTTV